MSNIEKILNKVVENNWHFSIHNFLIGPIPHKEYRVKIEHVVAYNTSLEKALIEAFDKINKSSKIGH